MPRNYISPFSSTIHPLLASLEGLLLCRMDRGRTQSFLYCTLLSRGTLHVLFVDVSWIYLLEYASSALLSSRLDTILAACGPPEERVLVSPSRLPRVSPARFARACTSFGYHPSGRGFVSQYDQFPVVGLWFHQPRSIFC